MQDKNIDDSNSLPETTAWIRVFRNVAIFVLLVWLVFGFLTFCFACFDMSKSGQIGDTFGAVNSLFSGLAFAGLIVTIWMQREDIAIQRKSLETQIHELRSQIEVSRETKEHVARQAEFAERTHLLGILNTVNQGFIEIAKNSIRQAAYEVIRKEFLFRLYTSGILVLKDTEDIWNFDRDLFISKLEEAKRLIESEWRRIRTAKLLDISGDMLQQLILILDEAKTRKAGDRWFFELSNYRNKIHALKEKLRGANYPLDLLEFQIVDDLLPILESAIESERMLDLRSIIENSKEFSKFSEIPRAN